MKRSRISVSVLALLSLLVLAPSASLWAQTVRGSITGLVKDSSGAIVVGATVTVTNPGTNASFTAKSRPDGSYLVPDLLPAAYRVTVEETGFKRLTVEGLTLDSGTTLTQDLTLQVGAVTETVNIQGKSELVNTSDGGLGATVDLTHILEIPLRDRLILTELNLVPGVFVVGGYDQPWYNYAITMTGPGERGSQEGLVTLDGVNNQVQSNGVGVLRTDPPPDVIQEMRVQTNNMTAEYGQNSSFSVNMVLKSGSNQFHGDVYEVVRNDLFDTAGWGNIVRPPLERNIGGLTVGGPIKKDKLFFFFGFERYWNRVGKSGYANLGLPAWRTGNFTTAVASIGGVEQVVPIYDPASGGTTQISCNGVMNVICPGRISTPATNVLSYLPQGNIAPQNLTNNSQNWFSAPKQYFGAPFYTGRLDYTLDSKTKLFFREFFTHSEYRGYQAGSQDPHWGAASNAQHSFQFNQNYAVNITRVFSPTFLMDLTFGWARDLQNLVNFDNPATNYGTLLGLANYVGPGYFGGFNFGGGLVPVDGIAVNGGRQNIGMSTQITPNFTKMIGNHSLKFGGQLVRLAVQNTSRANSTFTFNGQYTAQYNQTTGAQIQNTGINLADFLLGDYSAVSASKTPEVGERSDIYALYVQDNWRATRNLTLNLGLRWETGTPEWEVHNRMEEFNPGAVNPLAGTTSGGRAIPAGQLGITTFAGLNGQGKYMWNWQKATFSPRVGFAYRLFGRSDFVLRGGFGIFWDNPASLLGGVLGPAFGQTYSQSYSASPLTPEPSPPLAQGLPATVLTSPPVSALTATYGDIGTPYATSTITTMEPIRKNPYEEEYNLSLERQWKGNLIEVEYIGNAGRHMDNSNTNLNAIPQNLLSQVQIPMAQRRPFQQLNGSNATIFVNSDGICNSAYNALGIRTERRFTNGLAYTTAFTWSKWMDNQAYGGSGVIGSDDGFTTIQNPYNFAAEKSLSINNVPFRFVYAPIYELPIGKGKHFLNQGGVVNAILGGWEVSLMGTLQTGGPMDPVVSNGGSTLGDPNLSVRADMLQGCNPKAGNAWSPLTGGVRGFSYVNISCFVAPPPFNYGTDARTLPNIRGPGIAQQNFMLGKNFYYKERYRLQFRGEVIDIFNTPQFENPSMTFAPGSSTFGTDNTTDGFTRRVMEFSLKLYF